MQELVRFSSAIRIVALASSCEPRAQYCQDCWLLLVPAVCAQMDFHVAIDLYATVGVRTRHVRTLLTAYPPSLINYNTMATVQQVRRCDWKDKM